MADEHSAQSWSAQLSGNSLDDWWQWRRGTDARQREQDADIAENAKEIAVLKNTQQIMASNEAARHSKLPALTVSLISLGTTVLFFILQLIVSRIGQP